MTVISPTTFSNENYMVKENIDRLEKEFSYGFCYGCMTGTLLTPLLLLIIYMLLRNCQYDS